MQSRCVTAFNRVMWVKTKKPRPRLLVFLCIIVCLLTHLPVTRKVASSFHSSLHSQTWVRWCVGACMAHFIVLGCITMVITTHYHSSLWLITITTHKSLRRLKHTFRQQTKLMRSKVVEVQKTRRIPQLFVKGDCVIIVSAIGLVAPLP